MEPWGSHVVQKAGGRSTECWETLTYKAQLEDEKLEREKECQGCVRESSEKAKQRK